MTQVNYLALVFMAGGHKFLFPLIYRAVYDVRNRFTSVNIMFELQTTNKPPHIHVIIPSFRVEES